MIIKYNSQVGFKNRLEELVTLCGNFNTGLTEENLYKFLLEEECVHNTKIVMEPDIYDLNNPRPGMGWRSATLRYFSHSDEFSMFLPGAEMMPTESGVKDIQKRDPKEDEVTLTKTELLRYLKNVEVEVAKLKEAINGFN